MKLELSDGTEVKGGDWLCIGVMNDEVGQVFERNGLLRVRWMETDHPFGLTKKDLAHMERHSVVRVHASYAQADEDKLQRRAEADEEDARFAVSL